jgi:hypothetical protein
MPALACLVNDLELSHGLQEIFGTRWSLEHAPELYMTHNNPCINQIRMRIVPSDAHICNDITPYILCSIFRASWINLSRNNQQMSCHSTLFPVNSVHVSVTFRVHHQEIIKITCRELTGNKVL